MTDVQKCPYCGEVIKSIATKCKHCLTILSEVNHIGHSPDQQSFSPPSPLPTEKQVQFEKSITADIEDENWWCVEEGQAQFEKPVATPDGIKNSGKAIAALVMGIIGLAISVVPYIAFLLSGVGLILGIISIKSVNRKIAIAGIVICIIGIVVNVSVTVITLNFYAPDVAQGEPFKEDITLAEQRFLDESSAILAEIDMYHRTFLELGDQKYARDVAWAQSVATCVAQIQSGCEKLRSLEAPPKYSNYYKYLTDYSWALQAAMICFSDNRDDDFRRHYSAARDYLNKAEEQLK